MNEKSLIPSIRFAGFTDAWERRKLGEIADKVTEKNSSRIYSETFTNSAENGIISQRDYFDHAVSNSANLDGYYIVSEDDFVYNPRISTTAPVGPINRNRLKRRGVMSPLYTVFRTRDIDALYLEHYFKSHHWHQYMFLNGDSGARSDRFSIKDFVFMEMPIAVPCKVEQMRIGSFLEELDHLITLHQRKYEKLLNIKKSMLDTMFPKNGELFPEVRFAGFTDAWERRKVGEIAEKFIGGGTPPTANASYWNGEIPWFQSSDFREGKLSVVPPNKHISHDGLHNSAAQFIPANSIAIVVRVGVGKLAHIPFSYATSQDFVSLCNLKANPTFCVYSIYHKLQGELRSVQGTAIKGITKEDLLFKCVKVPCEKDEQKQIGFFFSTLDRLITLHQRKLEKLQNIKKACLEKMFV